MFGAPKNSGAIRSSSFSSASPSLVTNSARVVGRVHRPDELEAGGLEDRDAALGELGDEQPPARR
jgi:hypothetical protein